MFMRGGGALQGKSLRESKRTCMSDEPTYLPEQRYFMTSFNLNSMSDATLRSIAKGKNSVTSKLAVEILKKRKCVVDEPGKRTGLPKILPK